LAQSFLLAYENVRLMQEFSG